MKKKEKINQPISDSEKKISIRDNIPESFREVMKEAEKEELMESSEGIA